MRCPHCAGEISEQSRFCGICGRRLTSPEPAPGPEGEPLSGEASMSLFELPVSPGARVARVAAVLALDLILAGAGVAMILSYLSSRERAARPAPAPAQVESPAARVEEDEPVPVGGEIDAAPGRQAPDRAGASDGEPSSPPSASKPARGSSTRPAGGAGTDEPAPAPERKTGRDRQVARDPAPIDPYEEPAAGEPSAEAVEIFTGRVSVVFRRHQAQMQRCYEQAAKLSKKDDPLSGRIEVRFQITQDGRADNVRPVVNTTESEQLARCVTSLVSSWDFPEAPGSSPIDLMWPFRFSPP